MYEMKKFRSNHLKKDLYPGKEDLKVQITWTQQFL